MLLLCLRTKTGKRASCWLDTVRQFQTLSIAPDLFLSVVVALANAVQHVRVLFPPKLNLEGNNKIVNYKCRNALNAVDVALL